MSTNQNFPLTSHIVVFGASAPKEGEPLWNLSVELGDKLAQCGYSVCSGGFVSFHLSCETQITGSS